MYFCCCCKNILTMYRYVSRVLIIDRIEQEKRKRVEAKNEINDLLIKSLNDYNWNFIKVLFMGNVVVVNHKI